MAKSMKSTLNSYSKQYNKSKNAWNKKTGMTFKKNPAFYEKYNPKPYNYKPAKTSTKGMSYYYKSDKSSTKKADEQENNTNSSNGCYIATCVYGSYDCPEVWTLRRFRDYTLDETWYGRLFIRYYYKISPCLVSWFGEKCWFRIFWKKRLDAWVSILNAAGVENTEYNDKY